MLNNGGPRYKRSSLERQMNQDVLWCVLILIILCIIGAIGCKLWLSVFNQWDPPFKSEHEPSFEAFLAFWSYIIILQVGRISFWHFHNFCIADNDTVIPLRYFRDVQNHTSLPYPS